MQTVEWTTWTKVHVLEGTALITRSCAADQRDSRLISYSTMHLSQSEFGQCRFRWRRAQRKSVCQCRTRNNSGCLDRKSLGAVLSTRRYSLRRRQSRMCSTLYSALSSSKETRPLHNLHFVLPSLYQRCISSAYLDHFDGSNDGGPNLQSHTDSWHRGRSLFVW